MKKIKISVIITGVILCIAGLIFSPEAECRDGLTVYIPRTLSIVRLGSGEIGFNFGQSEIIPLAGEPQGEINVIINIKSPANQLVFSRVVPVSGISGLINQAQSGELKFRPPAPGIYNLSYSLAYVDRLTGISNNVSLSSSTVNAMGQIQDQDDQADMGVGQGGNVVRLFGDELPPPVWVDTNQGSLRCRITRETPGTYPVERRPSCYTANFTYAGASSYDFSSVADTFNSPAVRSAWANLSRSDFNITIYGTTSTLLIYNSAIAQAGIISEGPYWGATGLQAQDIVGPHGDTIKDGSARARWMVEFPARPGMGAQGIIAFVDNWKNIGNGPYSIDSFQYTPRFPTEPQQMKVGLEIQYTTAKWMVRQDTLLSHIALWLHPSFNQAGYEHIINFQATGNSLEAIMMERGGPGNQQGQFIEKFRKTVFTSYKDNTGGQEIFSRAWLAECVVDHYAPMLRFVQGQQFNFDVTSGEYILVKAEIKDNNPYQELRTPLLYYQVIPGSMARDSWCQRPLEMDLAVSRPGIDIDTFRRFQACVPTPARAVGPNALKWCVNVRDGAINVVEGAKGNFNKGFVSETEEKLHLADSPITYGQISLFDNDRPNITITIVEAERGQFKTIGSFTAGENWDIPDFFGTNIPADEELINKRISCPAELRPYLSQREIERVINEEPNQIERWADFTLNEPIYEDRKYQIKILAIDNVEKRVNGTTVMDEANNGIQSLLFKLTDWTGSGFESLNSEKEIRTGENGWYLAPLDPLSPSSMLVPTLDVVFRNPSPGRNRLNRIDVTATDRAGLRRTAALVFQVFDVRSEITELESKNIKANQTDGGVQGGL